MEDEKRLAREALKANGITPGEASEEELEILEKQIAHRRRGIRILKWCTYGALVLFILPVPFVLLVAGGMAPQKGVVGVSLGGIWMALLYLGLISAIFYWVRSYSISRMEMKAHLAKIALQLEKLTRQSEQSDDS